jgi:hypothetical protein
MDPSMARLQWVALLSMSPFAFAVASWAIAPAGADAQRAPPESDGGRSRSDDSTDDEVAPAVAAPRAAVAADPRCAEGADALWRGRIDDAERLGRAAIEALTPPRTRSSARSGTSGTRHVLARCHALVGRAVLARGSRDPSVHAIAAASLRRAFELEPSPDVARELASARWLGRAEPPLPIPAHDRAAATVAERAAIEHLRARPGARARTLRSTPTAGGPVWSVIEVELGGDRREESLVVVACAAGGRCQVDPILLAWIAGDPAGAHTRSSARLANAGFVATRRGLALVLDVDLEIERRPAGARAGPPAARPDARWNGRATYVRWIDGGALAGWNLLTRSRLLSWPRDQGPGPTPRADVEVRWGRRWVVIDPAPGIATTRLGAIAGARDATAMGCERCWLGRLSAPTIAARAP